MCGIAGIVDFGGKKADAGLLKKMTDSLSHRGPDGHGIQSSGGVGFGHRRLSILDLSSNGSQPMQDAEKTLSITFNGEIFNYVELKEDLIEKGYSFKSGTDTEVLLYMYREYGVDCLAMLNGMFAFAIHDLEKDKVVLARDRYGIKPLYYHRTGERILFASEIKAILACEDVKREPDEQAMFDYLVFNRYDHGENTFFKGIRRLKPSHVMEIEGKRVKVTRWWDTGCKKSKEEGYSAQVDEFRRLFEDSVRIRLRSDVPVGSCLSGGLDSSSIVSVTKKYIKNPKSFKTYSAVYDPGWEKDESRYVDAVSKKTGYVKKTVKPSAKDLFDELENFIYYQEEPVGHTSFFAQWMVMKLAKKNKAKVLLDGQGADEILAGYPYMHAYLLFEKLKNLDVFGLARELSPYLAGKRDFFPILLFLYLLLPGFLQKGFAKRINVGAKVTTRSWISKPFYDKYSKKTRVLEDFIQARDLNTCIEKHVNSKLEHLLRCEDKSSMAHSIETRLPFLDYRLVDHLLSTGSDAKIVGGRTKMLLRDSMKGAVPDLILSRTDKIGFETMEDDWFRQKALKEKILAILKSETFKARPYFVTDEVEKELKEFFEQGKPVSRTIWRWVNIELWFRTFIDPEAVAAV